MVAYTSWLAAAKNLEELKNLYRTLARQYHPDLGGSTRIMQEINAEYDQRTRLFKAGFVPVSSRTASANSNQATRTSKSSSPSKKKEEATTEWDKLGISKAAWEAYQAVREMRNNAPFRGGLIVEVAEGKVRVHGKATYHYREQLKALGFYWNSEKRYWYFMRKPNKSHKRAS